MANLTPTIAGEKKPRRQQLGNIVRFRMIAFFAVFGPGFITANVDNDPGGILTYSQAGAKFGYALLWTLIPTTIALIVVQEMAARMGAVTGKGLSDLIREEFGFRVTFFTMLVLGLADLGNIVAEFAGLASGMGLFGASKYIVGPDRRVLVWSVVVGEFLQARRTNSDGVVDSLFHLSSVGDSRPPGLATGDARHASSRT